MIIVCVACCRFGTWHDLAFARTSTFVGRAQIGSAVSSRTHEMAVNNKIWSKRIKHEALVFVVCALNRSDRPYPVLAVVAMATKAKCFYWFYLGNQHNQLVVVSAAAVAELRFQLSIYSTTPIRNPFWFGSALSCLCNWILAVSCHFRRVQWDRNRSICRVSFGVGVTWKYQMVTAAVNAANHSPTCHFFAFTYSHPFIIVIIIIETLTPATHLSDVFSFNNEPLQGSRVQEFTLKFDTMSHCFRINKSTYINRVFNGALDASFTHMNNSYNNILAAVRRAHSQIVSVKS